MHLSLETPIVCLKNWEGVALFEVHVVEFIQKLGSVYCLDNWVELRQKLG